ncbi:hypothetical protein GW17_00052870 [Ensete ventricosum]|nr:hypothetical protein GW17_00052870 [Ensete ventricosum]
MLRAANEELKLGANQDLVATAEHRAKELEETMEKLWIELDLDGARDDQARLEGDVMLLTEATIFLEAELKVEGPKVVAAYTTSRGFKSGLEKLGWSATSSGTRWQSNGCRGSIHR